MLSASAMRSPRAVEQQQHGGVAREHPVELGAGSGVDDVRPPCRPSEAWAPNAAPWAWRAAGSCGSRRAFCASSQRNSWRNAESVRASERLTAPVRRREARKPRKRLEVEPGEIGEARRIAELRCEVAEELADVARVGFERLFRMAALVAQVRQPRGDGALQIGAQRQLGFGGFLRHRTAKLADSTWRAVNRRRPGRGVGQQHACALPVRRCGRVAATRARHPAG